MRVLAGDLIAPEVSLSSLFHPNFVGQTAAIQLWTQIHRLPRLNVVWEYDLHLSLQSPLGGASGPIIDTHTSSTMFPHHNPSTPTLPLPPLLPHEALLHRTSRSVSLPPHQHWRQELSCQTQTASGDGFHLSHDSHEGKRGSVGEIWRTSPKPPKTEDQQCWRSPL